MKDSVAVAGRFSFQKCYFIPTITVSLYSHVWGLLRHLLTRSSASTEECLKLHVVF